MKKIVFILLIIGAGWQFYPGGGQVILGPGVMAEEEPYQASISSPVNHRIDDYIITEFAEISIKAKVLSRENYYLGREADLSPVDFTLGWGNMSDESILDNIKISQSNRFYHWQVESFPIPRREIESSSANMHLIPANETVASDIKKIRKGDIIELSGSLVNVTSASDGWRWQSSQTRYDTGKGACELIWVDSLEVVTAEQI